MKRIVGLWERFWFKPESVSTTAAVRIAFGFVVTAWTASLAPDLMTFFSREGIVPQQPSHRFWIGVLSGAAPNWLVYLTWGALFIAALCLMIGYHSRLASVLVFIGILSFERRNPFVFNAGDLLIRNIAFYLMFAPTGSALSLDVKRRAEGFWQFPKQAPWALRLIQIQLSVVYAATVWAKLRGTAWKDGTAVSYALRFDELIRFQVPGFMSRSELISTLLTYGTLAIEASIAVLVWNRRVRPWVLGAGVLLHLSIAVSFMIGFFSMAMLVAYLSFVPPETLERYLARFRNRTAESRSAFLRRRAPSTDSNVT